MTSGVDYRIKAADLRERATREKDPWVRAEFENLARAYLRLAQQADRNQQTDIFYETPPSKDNEPDHKF